MSCCFLLFLSFSGSIYLKPFGRLGGSLRACEKTFSLDFLKISFVLFLCANWY